MQCGSGWAESVQAGASKEEYTEQQAGNPWCSSATDSAVQTTSGRVLRCSGWAGGAAASRLIHKEAPSMANP